MNDFAKLEDQIFLREAFDKVINLVINVLYDLRTDPSYCCEFMEVIVENWTLYRWKFLTCLKYLKSMVGKDVKYVLVQVARLLYEC